jgi:Kef-type K+ transport system membrane component KefB
MEHTLFTEISLVVVVAFLVASLLRLLKQPLIIAYIISGLLLGPYVLDIIQSQEVLNAVSHIGVALLLFIVGLKLNPKEIRDVGRPAATIGIGQVILTTIFGFVLAQAFGYVPSTAIYIALAMTLSSTIVILKVISDKQDTDTLYAKISIGFLLVQDIIAAGLLVYVASVDGSESILFSMTESIAWLAAVGSLLAVISNYLLPKLSSFFARSQEYLFIFALAWGLGVSTLVATAGLSLEIGALLAGVLLSTQLYAKEISNRLRPLRDFFVLFFFITLGSGLHLGSIGSVFVPAVVFSLFVLVGNPLVVMALARYFGYTKQTSFKSAMTAGQVSEFSLIFILLAAEFGHVGEDIVTLVTLTALITIAGSTYMMRYDDRLYDMVSGWLDMFAWEGGRQTTYVTSPDIYLFGYARHGRRFTRFFADHPAEFVVVDYDPKKTSQLDNKHVDHVYGDVTDPELLSDIHAGRADVVISTISDFSTNVYLIRHLKSIDEDIVVVVYAEQSKQAAKLYENGASYVIMPHFLGGDAVLDMLKDQPVEESNFLPRRDNHLRFLQQQLDWS